MAKTSQREANTAQRNLRVGCGRKESNFSKGVDMINGKGGPEQVKIVGYEHLHLH